MLKAINDLGRQPAELSAALENAFRQVSQSGWFVLGPQVTGFEKSFAGYCGADHAVGVANGTDALELTLLALGAGPGDVVLTVANAGGYSTTAILATGAIPRYVDVDDVTLNIDAQALRQADWDNVKAVIVTHLYGLLAPVQEIVALAGAHGVPVIEDCAQAHGAAQGGRRAGSWGAAGCFSFYPTKNLGALGDGGAVITSDASLAKRLRELRQYGWSKKYETTRQHGRNSRLDEMQAAFLSVKLPLLDNWNRARRAIASRYSRDIRNAAVRQASNFDERHVAHLYVVRTEARAALQDHLRARGIPFDVHYPVPDYRQAALAAAFENVDLPVTERASRQVLTLPCFPEMTGEEVTSVVDAVNSWGGA